VWVRDRAALRAVLSGNVVVHRGALAVNGHALAAHLVGSGVIGDAVGHTIFAGAFAWAFVSAARRPAKISGGNAIDSKSEIGGFSILQAESRDAVTALLKDHPHFVAPGATIEVHEFMPIPGM